MSLKLTVLGSCGGYPRAGRACSGYLLESGGESLVLDMGMGVMSNMLQHVSFESLGGVALTHLHPDHFVDLYALYTARRFSLAAWPPLTVVVPPGAKEAIEVTLSGKTRQEFFEYLRFVDADEVEPLGVGCFHIESRPANHSVPAVSMKVTAGGRSICYTGDTDRSDHLQGLALGVDLFLCESTFTSELPAKVPGHLNASEAGQAAEEAGAGRLVVTHVWPTLDEERAVSDAAGRFGGTVEAAVEGMVFDV